MRIARFLASCGLGSRRFCEELIISSRIMVNDELVTTLTTDINPILDKITVEGEPVKPKKLVYYLLNKPKGYTTTRSDPHAEKFIIDLLPKDPPIWPVGRLDRETSGLIILTNDGDLTYKLTHPKYQKEKEYLIRIDTPLNDSGIEKIKKGIDLDDGLIKPDRFERINQLEYKITIHEGRKRLIRRLIVSQGKEVVSLKRIRIDNISLSKLAEGEYRTLSKIEVERLRKDV